MHFSDWIFIHAAQAGFEPAKIPVSKTGDFANLSIAQ
jgi:hypothetical protein